MLTAGIISHVFPSGILCKIGHQNLMAYKYHPFLPMDIFAVSTCSDPSNENPEVHLKALAKQLGCLQRGQGTPRTDRNGWDNIYIYIYIMYIYIIYIIFIYIIYYIILYYIILYYILYYIIYYIILYIILYYRYIYIIYIYIGRTCLVAPMQLNTKIIRGLVKRAQYLWHMHNISDTCTTSLKRAQHLWHVHNISETCTTSLKRAHIEYLKTLDGGGETRYAHIHMYMYIYVYISPTISYNIQCKVWRIHDKIAPQLGSLGSLLAVVYHLQFFGGTNPQVWYGEIHQRWNVLENEPITVQHGPSLPSLIGLQGQTPQG